MMKIWLSLALVLSCTALFAAPAYAYLDPGTGSMFFQAVMAGLLAAATAVGVFWQKIKAFFARTKGDRDDAGAKD